MEGAVSRRPRAVSYHLRMRYQTLVYLSNHVTLAAAETASAQSPRQPNRADIERETLEHFQAILRIDTRNPPGNERRAAEYIKSGRRCT